MYIPKRVAAVSDVALVAGGWRHTLAADREGRLYASGWNKVGWAVGVLGETGWALDLQSHSAA